MVATMQMHMGGGFRSWKKGVKVWLRAKLVIRPWEERPGPDDDRHRDRIFRTFSNADDHRTSGPRGRERQKRLHRRRSKLNGRFHIVTEVDHYCRGPGCCGSRDDCLQALDDDVVDKEVAPACSVLSRWLGSEDSLNFTAFWLACHALFMAGVLIGWLGISDLELVQAIILEIVSTAHRPDAPPLGFAETTKEMSDFERQTTHKSNTRLWLMSNPLPRLWVLKAPLAMQQRHQKELLKTSGPSWGSKQLKALANDKPRQYRPLLAADGTIVNETLKGYGQLLVSESEWEHIPAECQTHALAMSGFRATVKAICGQYQLEAVRGRNYPAKGFTPLRPGAAASAAAAETVVEDFNERPCVMDSWTFNHIREFCTVALLLGATSRAILLCMANLSVLENAGVEANNAFLRRRIKMRTQQKMPALTDVVADWLTKWSRSQRNSIWDDELVSSSDEEGDPPVMQGGGGGTYRGFISLNKESLKDERGVVQFSRAASMYRDAVAVPDDEVIKNAEARGAVATQAGRANFRNNIASWDASNFGTQRPRVEALNREKAEQKALLDRFDERVRSSNGVVSVGEQQLVVWQQHPMNVVHDIVVAETDGGLRAQLATLEKL